MSYIPMAKLVEAAQLAQEHLPDGEQALAGENWGVRVDGDDLLIYVKGEVAGRLSQAVLHGPSCATVCSTLDHEDSADAERSDTGPLWAFLLADEKSCMLLDGHEDIKELLGGRDAMDWFGPPGPGVWFWEGTFVSYGLDGLDAEGKYTRATVRNAIDAEAPEADPRGDHDRAPSE